MIFPHLDVMSRGPNSLTPRHTTAFLMLGSIPVKDTYKNSCLFCNLLQTCAHFRFNCGWQPTFPRTQAPGCWKTCLQGGAADIFCPFCYYPLKSRGPVWTYGCVHPTPQRPSHMHSTAHAQTVVLLSCRLLTLSEVHNKTGLVLFVANYCVKIRLMMYVHKSTTR